MVAVREFGEGRAPCARHRRASAFCSAVNRSGRPLWCGSGVRSRSTSANPPNTAIISRAWPRWSLNGAKGEEAVRQIDFDDWGGGLFHTPPYQRGVDVLLIQVEIGPDRL
jgi:hypothetical protein